MFKGLIPSKLEGYIIKEGELMFYEEAENKRGKQLGQGSLLGQGCFGSVRKARYRRVDDVAVKELINFNWVAFMKEASIMVGLKHDNVIALRGIDIHERPFKIVTEFMCGSSLDKYLSVGENQRYYRDSSITLLLELILQICRGMIYLEGKNISHGDLYLRNCLIGERNIVKICDFGLSKFKTDSSMNPSGIPTAIWQSLSQSQCYVSDVYAFGHLLWHATHLARHPHNACTPGGVRPGYSCPDGTCPIIGECKGCQSPKLTNFIEIEKRLKTIIRDYDPRIPPSVQAADLHLRNKIRKNQELGRAPRQL